MISLGPLSRTKHCPYKCAFCYVQDGFEQYDALTDDDILQYLKLNKNKFDIVYISGDTDSFAPPRTERAISLLKRLSKELDCDLLFTTRTTFSASDLEGIREVVKSQENKGHNLFSCVSITRYSPETEYLEPYPIPSPDERIETIKGLKNAGATTILAMRPFLPVVDVNDYLTLLEKTKGSVDIALGESFYFKPNEKVCERVFGNMASFVDFDEIFVDTVMDFDKVASTWKLWEGKEYEKIVEKKCKDMGIIFSMHSSDAIQKFKEKVKVRI